MPPKSMTKTVTKTFKNEAEEADWLASPAGKRFSERQYGKAVAAGKVIVSDGRAITEQDKESLLSGSVIRYRNGLDIKPTDPAVLQELMDRVKSKQTQAVSLRIPISDITAAKKIASETGLGYQTVLKEIISKGLRNV